MDIDTDNYFARFALVSPGEFLGDNEKRGSLCPVPAIFLARGSESCNVDFGRW
eukprot:COSAG02_NODE_7969_length_2766_cov_2.214098_1_plen_53_part_00